MNMHPVHYAPHHTGHLPLCGAEPDRPAGRTLIICTLDEDEVTCAKCQDVADERAIAPSQMEALASARDAIDSVFEELREQALFDATKQATLHALAHMLERAPWWALRYRFRLLRAMKGIAELTL